MAAGTPQLRNAFSSCSRTNSAQGAPHRLQHQQVTAVIVQHRQGSGGRIPSLGTFEVHLPEFVGGGSLEAFHGLGVPIALSYQIVTQQNAVNGAALQLHARPRQQHLQFARSPIGIALSDLHHPLFQLGGRFGTGSAVGAGCAPRCPRSRLVESAFARDIR
jgi:hypothetical protein